MNRRKFFLVSGTITMLFLFALGIFILSVINKNTLNNNEKSVFGELFKPYAVNNNPVNTLLLVSDQESGNTDTMIVVNYNPATAKLSLLSIPRDTKIPVKGSSIPKINSAYASGGADYAIDRVSTLLGIKIDYYVYFNILSFRKIIDLLDGVDFYIPVDLDYDDPAQNLHIDLKKGQQHLDGQKAEQLLRFRHPNGNHYTKEMLQYYDGSDLKRMDMQAKFIKEMVRQKVNMYYITRLNSIIDVVLQNVKTNITASDVLKMSHNLNKVSPDGLSSFKLSGVDVNGSIWYFVYQGQITETGTGKTYQADEILKQYFNTKQDYNASSGSENDSNSTQDIQGASPSVNDKRPAAGGSSKSYSRDNP